MQQGGLRPLVELSSRQTDFLLLMCSLQPAWWHERHSSSRGYSPRSRRSATGISLRVSGSTCSKTFAPGACNIGAPTAKASRRLGAFCWSGSPSSAGMGPIATTVLCYHICGLAQRSGQYSRRHAVVIQVATSQAGPAFCPARLMALVSQRRRVVDWDTMSWSVEG